MAIEEVKSTGAAPKSNDSKVPRDAAVATGSTTSLSDDELRRGKVSECAFDATEDPELYKPIDSYEGRHRWDPYFEWSEKEEKKLVRKVCTPIRQLAPILIKPDRYPSLHIRMHHLLCPPAGPGQYHPGDVGQHVG